LRLAAPGLPSYKLGEVAKTLGITPATAHRALGDAETTLLIYALASNRLESVD
jgi:DNA polymerase III epsilon subunit-like protein